jgi:predicted DNA-binding ribbon-helix-helix protein
MEAFRSARREGLQTTVSLEKVMVKVIWDIRWMILIDFTLRVVQ